MFTAGIVPTFGLWYDFRQRPPLGDFARFYAECFEEIEEPKGSGTRASGSRSTTSWMTVPAGAVLLVISGAWMAWSVLRRPSAAQAVGVQARPRVQ